MRVILITLLAFSASALAARHVPDDVASFITSEHVGSLSSGSQDFLHLWRRAHRDEDDDESEEKRAIFGIKFIVPPSEAEDFEDAWLDLEKDVDKDDDSKEIFDLKKTKLDNTLYLGYGEWSSYKGMHAHFTSKAFEKFSEFVSDHGVRWELRLLKSRSTDLEDDERGSRHTEVKEIEKRKGKNLAHVWFQYFVPPGEGEGFVDQWLESAKDTIEEKGNRIYSLRKVFNNNVEYWGYGTWDSLDDFIDHFESKHVSKLVDYVEDKDIVWVLHPLIKIGHDKE